MGSANKSFNFFKCNVQVDTNIEKSFCWATTVRKQQVTYNLKFNGLSIKLYGSYFEVYPNCANVTFCVCVILQREKFTHLEDTSSSSTSLIHIHVPDCVAEKDAEISVEISYLRETTYYHVRYHLIVTYLTLQHVSHLTCCTV